jgi:hypothetical protein
MNTVYENNPSKIVISDFKDFDGSPATPTAVSYRIDCRTTGTVIKADTAGVAASPVEITVAADDNAIVNPGNAYENRLMTVVLTGSGGWQVTKEFEWQVINLRGYTAP